MTEDKEIPTESNGQEPGSNEEPEQGNNENGAEEATELESAIIQQVEYYFGDMNLVRDKFLREQTKLDDGWVPLDVLTRFNRLAKLTKDTEVIANALIKSTSGLLEVSEDNKKVRRSPELPVPEMNEERRKELQERTIYAKGFPKDSELDELLKFFKTQGEIENVIMRRYVDRNTKKRMFKGSVFATFKTKELAEKFINSKGLKYGDTELIILWQVDYMQKKQEEYAEIKEKREKKNKDKEEKAKEEKDAFKLPTGTVFRITGVTDKVSREDIRAALTPLGAEVAYIEFKQGDTEGYVRLAKENSAKEVAEKITDGKLKIGESEVIFKILEGDDEKSYLEKTVEEMSKRRKNQKAFGRQNKGKNFKGKQGRKRKQEQSDDAPPSKVKAES